MRNLSLGDDSDLRYLVFRLSSTGQGETREPPLEDAGCPPSKEDLPHPPDRTGGAQACPRFSISGQTCLLNTIHALEN